MKSNESNIKYDELFEIIITFPYVEATQKFFDDEDPDGKEQDVIYERIRQIWISHHTNECEIPGKAGDKNRYPRIISRINPERRYYFQPEIVIVMVMPHKYSTITFHNSQKHRRLAAQKEIEQYFHEVYFHYQINLS